jgi:hypothetical protein
MGLFSFLFGSCSKPEVREMESRQALIADLRQHALTGSRAAFGLDVLATPTSPWGVVMEARLPEGTYTLVALSDGSASLYLSSGGGFIGGGDHETVNNAARAMVDLAARFQPLAIATTKFPLPQEGQTIFYLLTDSGVFTMNAPEQELVEEQHLWSSLFYAGQEVLTQYWLIEERR